jgi:hypothetical protein
VNSLRPGAFFSKFAIGLALNKFAMQQQRPSGFIPEQRASPANEAKTWEILG